MPVAAKDHVAVYAGSFDPITLGHLDVLGRSRRIFDRIVLAIGRNPEKQALFSFEERIEMARSLVNGLMTAEPGGADVEIAHYTGLTVDFARDVGACAILRGIRNITDLASETQLAITNRQVADIETVFVVTGEQFAFTSSSLIRQIAAMGGAMERLERIVPGLVIEKLKALQKSSPQRLESLARDTPVD